MLDRLINTSPLAPSAAADTPEKVKGAARQFEALLIGQMMKSMRDTEGGWMGTQDESASSAMEYAQEVFSQSLAAGGGLGLGHLIADGLRKPSES